MPDRDGRDYKTPYICWSSRDGVPGLTVFTECCLGEVLEDSSEKKVAWLIEPSELKKKEYKTAKTLSKHFDKILTYSKKLIKKKGPFTFYPFGCYLISSSDWAVHEKSKNLSIIASEKNCLKGHKLRHRVIKTFGNQIDGIYGRGYHPIENKLEGLKNYRYSIVIENCREDYFFSEKLMDCLLTGTIPIYWGCPSIGNFFDLNGISTFTNRWQLRGILKNISKAQYEGCMEAVLKNFEIAKKYLYPEKFIYEEIKSMGILDND